MTRSPDTETERRLDRYLAAAALGHSGLLAALRLWRLQMPDDLLRAALLPGTGATDPSALAIDPDSVAHRQLLPHLDYSLGQALESHPLLQTLRLARMRTGLFNQKIRMECREVLDVISAAGLEALVFKGADLAFSTYPDPCCRIVGDIDLLVDENEFDRVIAVLQAKGWVSDGGIELPAKDYIRRSLNLRHPGFIVSLDVQNHANSHSIWPGADRMYFAQAVTRQNADGWSYRALCPEHALVQICGHGIAQTYFPPVRWAADAVWILRAAGQSFDWAVMMAAMRGNRSAPILSVALAYLHLVLDVDVPPEVLNEAQRVASTRAFRQAWRYRLVLPRGNLHGIWALLARFHEAAPEQSIAGLLARFPAYVRNSQGKKTTLAGLTALGRRAYRRKG